MSRVVKNNLGFLQALLSCAPHQRQYLLTTATPEQVHALVQATHNVLSCNVPTSEEERIRIRRHKDAQETLIDPATPFKKKKQLLVQEGGSFIPDLLVPVLASLLMV